MRVRTKRRVKKKVLRPVPGAQPKIAVVTTPKMETGEEQKLQKKLKTETNGVTKAIAFTENTPESPVVSTEKPTKENGGSVDFVDDMAKAYEAEQAKLPPKTKEQLEFEEKLRLCAMNAECEMCGS